VSVSHKDRNLVIIYQDNGIGIPTDLDWQNTASLGLRLVTSLVDQMNGTIELDRSEGTRFTIVVTEKKPKDSS
jgi:two-component sensor histidine kinase